MKATVYVTRRADISDPQGTAVLRGVHDLGYSDVTSVRMDKMITLHLDTTDPSEARTQVEELCRTLLANPVMEDFEIVLEGGETA